MDQLAYNLCYVMEDFANAMDLHNPRHAVAYTQLIAPIKANA